MHIAYLTSEFVTEEWHGGLATYLNNIASIMSEHGHVVTIITLSEQDGRISYKNNIEVVRVEADKIRSNKNTVGRALDLSHNSWKLYQALIRENRKKKIDIVHAANFHAAGLFRCYSIPTVVRVSSEASLVRQAAKYEFDYEAALKEKNLEDKLELWCVKQADAAFAPSRFCADVIQKKSGRKVSVIETPYFPEECVVDESVYRDKLLHKKYLLFNSTMSRLKGTHIGIQATEQLMAKYPDLHMVYAGYDYGLVQKNGNIQKIAEILRRQNKKYEGRVIYLGHLSHEKLFPVIQNALACVLPSRVDNLPNSCIEAMSMGSVVIGTFGASFEQLIRNKENGLLIKRDSSASFIRAVEYLMSMSEQEYLCMKQKAVQTVDDRLNPQKIYNEVISLYKKVIKEH